VHAVDAAVAVVETAFVDEANDVVDAFDVAGATDVGVVAPAVADDSSADAAAVVAAAGTVVVVAVAVEIGAAVAAV
jgi:hypothetical protein